MTRPRVLLVGNPLDCQALAELLSLEGHCADVASQTGAVRTALRSRPDIVIADVPYPAADGLALLRALSLLRPTPRLILISSRPTRALEPQGVTCLSKPLDLAQLLRTLDALAVAAQTMPVAVTW